MTSSIVFTKRVLIIFSLCLAFTVHLFATCEASARSAKEARVQRVANQVLAIARSGGSASAFRSLMLRNAAVSRAALFALGKYKRQLPKRYRKAYVRLYADYIAKLFSRHHQRLRGDQFVVTGIKGGHVRGHIVQASGRKLPIEWRMAGSKIFDVKIAGVWLGLRVRTDFVRVLNQGGGDFNRLFQYMQRG